MSQEQISEVQTETATPPYAEADASLRGLAARAEGFGRHAIGGLHGEVYHVTTLADDGCGSLREACRRREPLWVVFDVSGTISLSRGLPVTSYKTIDGRGQRVRLACAGQGLQLWECEHVIVCNLEIEGGRGNDVDAIQVKPFSRHIWIDRCSLRDFEDGLIDITCGSTDVTVSRCHFSSHDKTMLIGGCSSHIVDRCSRVTIHHCFFDGTGQRHPRVRFAKVHLYNNYTRNWRIYAVCASVESKIVSQCNVYEAGEQKTVFLHLKEKAADTEESSGGSVRSEGDLFLNGARDGCGASPGAAAADETVPYYYRPRSVRPASAALKELLQSCAGWQPVAAPPDDVCFTPNTIAA